MIATTVPLYAHQQAALELVEQNNGCAGLFMDMGTGKSRTALAYMWARGVQSALIVCPLSAVGVWRREIHKIGYLARIVDLTTCADGKARAGVLKGELQLVRSAAPIPTIVLVNYESYWRPPLRDALLKFGFDAVILDEAHRIKHRSTKQARMAHIIGDRPTSRIKLALTGTPITNGLQDAWSIYRFFNPSIFGTWSTFSHAYLRFGGYLNKQITGYNNLGQAKLTLARTAYQVSKEDCLDLPERTDVVVPVQLSPATKAAYNELRKNGLVELQKLGTGAAGDGTVIARIVLTLVLRLQQITGGFATDEAGNTLDLGTEKADATAELIEDAHTSGQRVIVFARFLHDLDKVQRALHATQPHLRIARIDGSVSGVQRTAIQDNLHAGLLDVVLCQIRSGSVAMDFTPASVAIFYSTGFSLDDFHQARDRLHRIGQHRPVTYYLLSATGVPTDEKIIEALQAKASLAREVTSLRYALNLLGGNGPQPNESDNESMMNEALRDAMGIFAGHR